MSTTNFSDTGDSAPEIYPKVIEPRKIIEEPDLVDEVAWGQHYRPQRAQQRRKSISPTRSPINMTTMWEKFILAQEKRERLRHEPRPCAIPPKARRRSKGVEPGEREVMTHKQYIDFLATPRKYVTPHWDKPPKKPKIRSVKEECNPRILELSAPDKKRVLGTWQDHGYILGPEAIARLDAMLHSDRTLDAQFARCYFKQLDRKKKKLLKLKKKERLRKLRQKQRGDTKWMRDEADAITDSVVSFFKREPNFSLNFKQMMISDAIIKTLKDRRLIKIKGDRTTNRPYAKAVIEIADQLAVWIDTITRYLDVQSIGDLEALPSVSAMEEEGEEEEEEEEGSEGEEEESLEGELSTPTPSDVEKEGVSGMYLPAGTEPIEPQYETEGTVTDREESKELITGMVAEDIAAELASLDDDSLEILIQILSSSTPETLQRSINQDTLPGVTYGDILDKLKLIRQKPHLQAKERKTVLEGVMMKWAKENDEPKVTPDIENKIRETAEILAEWLTKDAAKGWEGALLADELTTTTTTTSDADRVPRPLETLAEEIEPDLSGLAVTTETSTEEEESPSPLSTGDTGDTIETEVMASDLDTTKMIEDEFVTDTPGISDLEDLGVKTPDTTLLLDDQVRGFPTMAPGDFAVDKSGQLLLGSNGMPIEISPDQQVVFNAEGEPVLDKDGVPLIIPSDRRVTLLSDGKPLLDANGLPILTPEDQQIAVGPDGKTLLGSDGEPLVIPAGQKVSLSPEGLPLLGEDGKPLLIPADKKLLLEVTPTAKDMVVEIGEGGRPPLDEEGLVPSLEVAPDADGKEILGPDGKDTAITLGPDGEVVLGPDGKPLVAPEGSRIALGSDGKPLLGPDGKPLFIPEDMDVEMGADGRPLLDADGKPILVPGLEAARDDYGREILDSDGKPILIPRGTSVTLDPDGKVVLGPDGKPLLVPKGSRIALGSDGKPLLGPDGKPLLIPEDMDVEMGADGQPLLGADGKPLLVPGLEAARDDDGREILDSDGKPIMIPRGASVTLDPDGKVVFGPDGKPLLAPKGSRIALGSDGKPLLGPDGKPLVTPKASRIALGTDGKPLLGPDGKPLLIPEDMQVEMGADGRPLLGADGKPLVVPTKEIARDAAGAEILGPDGKPVMIRRGTAVSLGPDGQILLGPDGKPLLAPTGTQPALGRDGKPLLGTDGKPLFVPDGFEVCLDADGRPILDADGRPKLKGQVIKAHKPSKVFEHETGKICCLSLKVWASWLLEVANNARMWSTWLAKTITEVRRIVRIIKGEVLDESGRPEQYFREDWLEFSRKVSDMAVSWRQYSQHVRDLTDELIKSFHGKPVECCPRCLQDQLITNIPAVHGVCEQLNEAVNTAQYWRRWLDSIVEQTSKLTAALGDWDYDMIDVTPGITESGISLVSAYSIEELDPCDCYRRRPRK